MFRFLRRCGRFLSCEKAVSALEYAVLAGVVLAGVGAAIVAFTGDIATSIGTIGEKLDTGAQSIADADLDTGDDE